MKFVPVHLLFIAGGDENAVFLVSRNHSPLFFMRAMNIKSFAFCRFAEWGKFIFYPATMYYSSAYVNNAWLFPEKINPSPLNLHSSQSVDRQLCSSINEVINTAIGLNTLSWGATV